jgi:hypothetical protein
MKVVSGWLLEAKIWIENGHPEKAIRPLESILVVLKNTPDGDDE